MRKKTGLIVLGIAAVSMGVAVATGGCASLVPPVDFALSEGLGSFDVEAGAAVENKGTGSFSDFEVTVGSGTISIPASAITVTPTDQGAPKGSANLQTSDTLEITVWIDGFDELETVCGGGEQYGPFTVTLGENSVPVSVSPSSVTLSSATLDLLNGGDFSVCLSVLSTVTGTITIDALTFQLGL